MESGRGGLVHGFGLQGATTAGEVHIPLLQVEATISWPLAEHFGLVSQLQH